MKLLLGTLARNESKYIREWVLHYKSLGFDKIFFCDNNDVGDNSALEVLREFVESEFVKYIDLRGKPYDQKHAFRYILQNYRDGFDWAAFLDLDEYINSCKDIKELISMPKFSLFRGIRLNWRTYTDNDFIVDPPDLKSYTEVCSKESKNSTRCKTLIRLNGLKDSDLEFVYVHGVYNDSFRFCNSLGLKCNSKGTMVNPVNWKNLWIDHYKWRSVSNFCDKLVKFSVSKVEHMNQLLNEYFADNKKTKEKVDYINNILKKNGINYEYHM